MKQQRPGPGAPGEVGEMESKAGTLFGCAWEGAKGRKQNLFVIFALRGVSVLLAKKKVNRLGLLHKVAQQ